jgi:hypothetical protein
MWSMMRKNDVLLYNSSGRLIALWQQHFLPYIKVILPGLFHVSTYKQNEAEYTRNRKYSLHIGFPSYHCNYE